MGMSLKDFDLCTPPEFKKIFEKWREGEEQQMRRSWEQTRQLALCMLQPWSKNKLEAEDVMVFSWERAAAPQHSEQKAMTAFERKRHYEEVKKARGLR